MKERMNEGRRIEDKRKENATQGRRLSKLMLHAKEC